MADEMICGCGEPILNPYNQMIGVCMRCESLQEMEIAAIDLARIEKAAEKHAYERQFA